MSTQKDVRVEVKLRNDLLLTALEQKGIASLAELSRRLGFSKQGYSILVKLVGMKLAARDQDDHWLPIVYELAEFFECMPEDLFSEAQQNTALKKNTAHAAVSYGEVQQYLAGRSGASTPELALQAKELRATLTQVLSTLTPREERILRMRFGFVTGEEMTLEEIADTLQLSGNRVSQIEAKALRKLKHPSRGHLLRSAGKIDGKIVGWDLLDGDVLEAL